MHWLYDWQHNNVVFQISSSYVAQNGQWCDGMIEGFNKPPEWNCICVMVDWTEPNKSFTDNKSMCVTLVACKLPTSHTFKVKMTHTPFPFA